MNSSYAAYVDEAGDDGCTPKSSEWLILSAVVTNKATDARTLKTVFDSSRLVLNKSEQKPFHFRRLPHHQRVPYVSQIAGAPVAAITVLVNKQSVWRDRFSDRHRLYHYAIRLLVERISWLSRDRNGTISELMLSTRRGLSSSAVREYLDSLLANPKPSSARANEVRIAPGTMERTKVFTFENEEMLGLQMADAVASGFYNAVEARYGFIEARYARMLKPIVYNYRGRYRSYGLKFFPPPAEKLIETDPRLKWVVEDYSK